MEPNFNKFTSNFDLVNNLKSSDLYLKQIETETKLFLKSKVFKKKRIINDNSVNKIHKHSFPYRKYLKDNLILPERILDQDKYNSELLSFFSTDVDFLKYEKIKNNLQSLSISDPIQFNLLPKIDGNSNRLNISKEEAKSIILNIHPKEKKHKSKMVYEDEVPFSDDSIDSDICPIHTNNEAEFLNIQTLSDILVKNKKASEIKLEIKKKKNAAKLKLQLEKDFMIILSSIKKLEIEKKI